MFTEAHAAVYELLYRGRGKDWGQEAKVLAERIREIKPDADSLLDVACGTGAHLETFVDLFGRAEGLELAVPMLELARKRLPGVTLHEDDMRTFDLGTTYDAMVCMYCSIGYLDDSDDLRAALRAMSAHLNPGGVLIIEPWWFPEQFIEGYAAGFAAQEGNRVVTRVSHSTKVGHQTRMDLRYVYADDDGITQFTEIDMLCLWTKEEYLSAFADAGCPATYTPGWPTGRGLFIGTKES
ncbi:SAM-dependent methyltransferase [Actinophytocola xinjiangensis]|uniref:SAM-dependent methyltransferase n=1 Tax=Actinophytocola xinjiangensis TaxID=485602 RepID=A0A7Z0WT12_9PSEU|nr:class I SAM-dependent methyltransferase [Actinophytocola xinjiangensis]OLF14443.1 SAM-dependent methyltransferase [Actinophytocola xinjiangensis]